MSTLRLKPLTPADFEAAYAIFESVFPVKYSLEFLDAWKGRSLDLSLGAFSEDESAAATNTLIGFILCSTKEPNQVCIEFLGVSPTCQKGGTGTSLLRHILDYCQRSHSRVTLIPVNDQRIIQWYKKHGFTEFGAPFISRYTGDIEQPMAYIC